VTLILTELSQAGIAMAADSAISMSVNGQLVTKDKIRWKKLLKVPKIKAGVSYWGSVGLVTPTRFDEWLEQKINRGSYTDLRSLADYLTIEMNSAAGNTPVKEQVGVHVAGLQLWKDGISRPTFYHIHNGHSHVVFEQSLEKGQLETRPVWHILPRELFARHDDFSPESRPPDALSSAGAYLTRNGDYAAFHIISENVVELIRKLDTVPGFKFSQKLADLGPRGWPFEDAN
jgi:hypothetical protein